MNEFFKKLTELHPYITVCSYNGQDYVGIIQNRDDNVTTLYDYGAIVEPELKVKFLELGNEWWWSSNRQIPINLFLKDDWSIFRNYVKTFNNKGLEILHGPVVCLTDLSKRRTKRKSIILVKRLP
jgi:hypothetical protein